MPTGLAKPALFRNAATSRPTISKKNNAAPVSRDGVFLGFSSIRRPSYATGLGRPTKWISSNGRCYKMRGFFDQNPEKPPIGLA